VAFSINRVYTRSGDLGKTALVGGKRVSKADFRVCSYGDIDELNSHLGLIIEKLTPRTAELQLVLQNIQQELFDLGSQLATPNESEYDGMWKVGDADTKRLEELCDRYNQNLPELKSFILPGGSELAALLHIARTVARRAERSVVTLADVSLSEGLPFDSAIVTYVNRLSDLLFILARWCLQQEEKEVPLWVKASERRGV